MESTSTRTLAGAALVGLGALALLQNFGLLGGLAALVWATAFAAAGAAFLGAFLRGRAWWAAIPGTTLLGIGATIALSTLTRGVADELIGALVPGAIGAGFLLIYIARQEYWWALIPGGVMLSVAAVVALSPVLGDAAGAILFVGMGLTFGALTRLPGQAERMRWALIPAGVMLAMGAVVLLSTTQLANIVVPLVLIAGGVALLYRTGVDRRRGSER